MDLSKCKLICRSKSRLAEKPSDCKYWESAASSNKSLAHSIEYLDKFQERLAASRSVPRLIQKTYEDSNQKNISSNSKLSFASEITSKKSIHRLSPLRILKERKFQNVPWSVPLIMTGNPLRSGLRPNALVPIHKPHEEKPIKVIEWAPPVSRSGMIGSKFVKAKSKSPIGLKIKQDRAEKNERKQSQELIESDREFYEYKEPYIQLLLKKNQKEFGNLFNNPISIL